MNSLEVSDLLTQDRQHWLPSLENCESMPKSFEFFNQVGGVSWFHESGNKMLWVAPSLTGSSFYLSSPVGPSVCRPV